MVNGMLCRPIIVVVFKFRLVYLQKVSATIGFDKRKIKKKLLAISTNQVIIQIRGLLTKFFFI